MEPDLVSDDKPARPPRDDDARRGGSSGRAEQGRERRGPAPGSEHRGGPGGERPRRDDRGSSGARPRGSGRGDDRRGADRGARGGAERDDQRGGSMLVPKKPRLPEPAIPDDVTGFELDRSVKNQ